MRACAFMQEVSGGSDIRGAEIANAIRVLSNAYSHAFSRTITGGLRSRAGAS